VDRAQLRVHYQPKVCITNRAWSVTGIEALLRWDHPDYGLIYPEHFIGIAERNGLIAGLTDFVLQAVVEQISEWNRIGLNLNLCVNLSPTLVTDDDFPDRMLDFLRQRNVSPSQLTIDITETAALADPEPTFEIPTRLREKQFGLSLDDFGTGYSSLTQLYKLPFSEIKIDRSFGMELGHSEKVRTIVRAMIDLGHSLNFSVCCEGVESASALAFLQQAGCDSAQGYYIARPMPPGRTVALAGWGERLEGRRAQARPVKSLPAPRPFKPFRFLAPLMHTNNQKWIGPHGFCTAARRS
jgi:EAL domain-containing protein (putative c-di-GMP-specific phosphodiesterase class I)